jgi:hypothetical protein
MSRILDNTLVALALVASTGYAVASLGPRSLRRRLTAQLGRLAARAPAYLGLRRVARRFAAAAEKAPGACGGCDNCGSEPAPPPDAPAGPATRTEIRVPVSRTGRRVR